MVGLGGVCRQYKEVVHYHHHVVGGPLSPGLLGHLVLSYFEFNNINLEVFNAVQLVNLFIHVL